MINSALVVGEYFDQLSQKKFSQYSDENVYDIVKRVFNRETKFKMSSLLYRTLNEIAENLGKEIDVDEPVSEPIKEDIKKKRGKLRQLIAKNKEEEEHLFY